MIVETPPRNQPHAAPPVRNVVAQAMTEGRASGCIETWRAQGLDGPRAFGLLPLLHSKTTEAGTSPSCLPAEAIADRGAAAAAYAAVAAHVDTTLRSAQIFVIYGYRSPTPPAVAQSPSASTHQTPAQPCVLRVSPHLGRLARGRRRWRVGDELPHGLPGGLGARLLHTCPSVDTRCAPKSVPRNRPNALRECILRLQGSAWEIRTRSSRINLPVSS